MAEGLGGMFAKFSRRFIWRSFIAWVLRLHGGDKLPLFDGLLLLT
jgi:hypothetical protein